MPHPAPSAPRSRGRRERGSATAEHVGALAQLGLLVLALGATMVASGGSLATKVCEIYTTAGEAGEKVDLGGDLKVDAGSTWNFANRAEADAMRKQLDDYRRDQTIKLNSPAYLLWTLVHGGKKPPRPPDQSVVTLDLGRYLDGKAGVRLPWQEGGPTVPSPPLPGVSGVTPPTPPQVGITFAYDDKWTTITDSAKQTRTYTTTGEGYGQINGTVGPLKGEYKGLLGSSGATAFPDTRVPGDDFQNLVFDGSTVSDVHYANVTDKVGFAAKVKAGVSIGVDLGSETNDSRATGASYLGAPGSGASTRTPVPFPGCTGS